MDKRTFIPVGQLLKSVGTSGEIKYTAKDEFYDDLVACNHFFVKYRGNYIPYFIEYFKDVDDNIIKIEEIDAPEAANRLVLEEIYLRKCDIHSEAGESYTRLSQLENYIIYDHGIKIGSINEVQELPQQLIAHVSYNNKSVMIPLHDSLIKQVDNVSKIIYMELPEGILEL